jgi:hypothetical protein
MIPSQISRAVERTTASRQRSEHEPPARARGGLFFGDAKRDNWPPGSASAVNAAAVATREARNEHDRNRDLGAPGAGRCQRMSQLSSRPGHRACWENWIGSRRAMSRSSVVVSMVEQLVEIWSLPVRKVAAPSAGFCRGRCMQRLRYSPVNAVRTQASLIQLPPRGSAPKSGKRLARDLARKALVASARDQRQLSGALDTSLIRSAT